MHLQFVEITSLEVKNSNESPVTRPSLVDESLLERIKGRQRDWAEGKKAFEKLGEVREEPKVYDQSGPTICPAKYVNQKIGHGVVKSKWSPE